MFRRFTAPFLGLAALVVIAPSGGAQDAPTAGGAPASASRAAEMTARAARYLIAAQESEGGWASQRGPGITCLVLKALIREPTVGPDHPAVRRGLEFVLRFQRDDGGIYAPDGLLKSYETSVALATFAALAESRSAPLEGPSEAPARSIAPGAPPSGEPRVDDLERRIVAAQKFLKDNQWDEGDNVSVDNPWFGGAGYGHGKRPDLSNTQMMLEALHDSGLPKDDPVYRKAVAFISRCQMLAEQNDQPFARGSRDGGFIYSPANGGESKAGEWEVEGRRELRSYGTMTYAGFKSLLYAGLERNDPRVTAALNWIRRHWTLDHNPNMPERQSREGLYYYYHVFARALRAWGEPRIEDAAGRVHDWRSELTEKLARLQRDDGSWVNDADRWMEGEPALTTAYAMLALQAAHQAR